MKILSHDLTYCLNVHPGETWADNLAAIKTHTLPIRDQVAGGKPFGLGLRLSHQAATTLKQSGAMADFKKFMAEENLYAFTINGFPYGSFHTQPVKTAVYQPDWSTRERLDYTITLAELLAEMLPEEMDGSISTLPLGYKFTRGKDHSGTPSPERVTHLAECALALHKIRLSTGREVHIGLEPEPDCLLETTADVIQFFETQLIPQGSAQLAERLSCNRQEAEKIVRRHLGLCFDTCHLAIQFEDLSASLTQLVRHGIRISKVQLSSALEVIPTRAARTRLNVFLDPVYLHQVKGMILNQNVESRASLPDQPSVLLRRYGDLDEALASPCTPDGPASLWRIHFHVPLYFEGDDQLHSTASTMTPEFWHLINSLPTQHLEIETYTFHVLPPTIQAGGVVASTVREYEWAQDAMMTGSWRPYG